MGVDLNPPKIKSVIILWNKKKVKDYKSSLNEVKIIHQPL